MGELRHDPDFSPNFPGINGVDEQVGAPLNGDFLASFCVEGGDDHAVGAAAELPEGLVIRV